MTNSPLRKRLEREHDAYRNSGRGVVLLPQQAKDFEEIERNRFLDRLEEVMREEEKKWSEYIDHTTHCDKVRSDYKDGVKCSCGLDELLR